MKIWIINHNAIPPSLGGLTRHYYFKKCLEEKGHSVRIFTASQIHNSDVNMINGREKYSVKIVDGVEYTFVRTPSYKGNGLSRIRNMLEFPLRIWGVCKNFEKPDVIYTSSPDIFPVFSALLMAKKYKLPCVVEIRDLWPESIVAYKRKSRKNPIIIALYWLEKWIYKKADRLIFTIPGGADYILDKGWDKAVDMSKVHHINNGVDLEEFDRSAELYQIDDPDLSDVNTFKIIYTGSIRAANNLRPIVEAAKILHDKSIGNIKFILYGQGDDVPVLKRYAEEEALDNVVFKGFVEKKFLPFVLRFSDLNLLIYKAVLTQKYGGSQNKKFEYFASRRPVLSTIQEGYCLIKKYGAGVVIDNLNPHDLAEAILQITSMNKADYEKYCINARHAAEDHDYKALADKLIEVLEGAINT